MKNKNIRNNPINTDHAKKTVEVSARLFLENGIASVKMTDIARECGVGVATLYRWFGTKNSLAITAMTYLWNELHKMFS